MIVYVETNFILELAYEQEGCDSCRRLLEWAEAGRIRLVLPAYSAIEARTAWQLKIKRRLDIRKQLSQEIHDLARTQELAHLGEASRALMTALVDRGDTDRANLETALEAIERYGSFAPTTTNTVRDALRYERELGLTTQDATVYAAICAQMAGDPEERKVFVTRNGRDFVDPGIKEQLEAANCRLFTRFEDAVGYVGSVVDAK